jgi:hypothetical protein
MDPSEKFVKFAVECERMAKFTHSRGHLIMEADGPEMDSLC